MSNPEKQALQKQPEGAAEGEKAERGWLSWAVGWVLVPGTLIGLIFGAGLMVGVHLHDSWFSRLVVWFVELFG
ncbi:MAG: hypothetical protein H6712_16605 [Myxococcales bacterium]|nr:hypothetical protein [Myxococcales bacterium]MCB9715492.1 hypothetical protein [Myxococcales bacterium]